MKWYTLSAQQGNADAQYSLGTLYQNGHGVLQDNARAYMWFNISASTGHKIASKVKEIFAQQMTTSQIEHAQKLAQECVAKNYKGC